MELTQLNQFRVIASCGSISEASELLHITQPALSRSIQKLEQELGIVLFERVKNRIQLNQAGKIVLESTNDIFREVEKMRLDLSNCFGKTPILRIGSVSHACTRYVVSLFNVSRPDVLVTAGAMYQSDAAPLLFNQTIDIAISAEPIDADGIVSCILEQEHIIVSVPSTHTLAHKKSMELADLDGQDFMRFKGGDSDVLYGRVNALLKRRHVHTRDIYQNDYFVYQQMLKTSDFLGFTSNIELRLTGNIARRRYYPIAEQDVNLTYHLAYLQKNADRLQPFLQWVRQNYMTNYSGILT